MARILILGAGFAGLWAAIGAARKRDEAGDRAAEVEITVVDRNPYHNIRVRNYEVDITDATIPLAKLLDPVGVKHVVASVEAIDTASQDVIVATAHGRETIGYDRLVLALGSELVRPAIPGLAQNGFDVDTYAAAQKLNAHLASLRERPASPGRNTVIVVGAGFTGIEVAAEMPQKLRAAGVPGDYRVILVDPNPVVGATIGDQARPVINEALSALHVETRLGARARSVDATGLTLEGGEFVPAETIIWCAGMAASPLAATLPGERDRYGRLIVDQFLRVNGLGHVFAAGDVANRVVDGEHATVMSCQFARPMGRFAGHNVVADLLGLPMLPLNIDWYVTVLDLGGWGALYTTGWDREVHSTGAAAKTTKQTINHQRIYPPRSGDRAALFAAAAPTVQAPPYTRTAATPGRR
jgi:NADH:ubiquinone reductase (H+-translocating)